jgi:hypothetical protein
MHVHPPRDDLNSRDLSVETIALILSLANVCAGGRYLVIDETGLLIAAILERGTARRLFLLLTKIRGLSLSSSREPRSQSGHS